MPDQDDRRIGAIILKQLKIKIHNNPYFEFNIVNPNVIINVPMTLSRNT